MFVYFKVFKIGSYYSHIPDFCLQNKVSLSFKAGIPTRHDAQETPITKGRVKEKLVIYLQTI